MFTSHTAQIPILYIIILIIAIYVGWKLRTYYKRLIFFYLKKKGSNAEKKAIRLLENDGYNIIKIQPTLEGYLFENKIKKFFIVRPDLIVNKNGRNFIVEIKAGEAASIDNVNTRRQLLEYNFLYNNNIEDIILIEPENKKIKYINFCKYN